MKNQANVLQHLRVSRLVSGLILMFAILFVGETAFSYFELGDTESLELSENQEEESKSETGKELEDADKLINGLPYYRFAISTKSTFDHNYIRFSEGVCSFVDTPPPELI